jgi:hypothetical protein
VVVGSGDPYAVCFMRCHCSCLASSVLMETCDQLLLAMAQGHIHLSPSESQLSAHNNSWHPHPHWRHIGTSAHPEMIPNPGDKLGWDSMLSVMKRTQPPPHLFLTCMWHLTGFMPTLLPITNPFCALLCAKDLSPPAHCMGHSKCLLMWEIANTSWYLHSGTVV